MQTSKREHPPIKLQLHPRNKHRERYDFKLLCRTSPELTSFVKLNPYGDESIDFFDPDAVKMLNKALLKQYYKIENWVIPSNYLCPPIPGRADYIHYVADLLGLCDQGKIPIGNKIKCLDIGIGANCVYPIIGNHEYGWSFVGSDIDPSALKSVHKIIEDNPFLKGRIEPRLQSNPKNIFRGIIQKDDLFDLTICNPPFHASLAEAQSGSIRKLSNLKGKSISNPILNFGGKSNELWCTGGEVRFISDMIFESKEFSDSCLWFSTLVSKESNLERFYENLKRVGTTEIKTFQMGQGNKISRILAWTFLSLAQQQKWATARWKSILTK